MLRGNVVKTVFYNENTQELEIPFDVLSKGVSYAEKNEFNSIKIINSIEKGSVGLDLTPLAGNNSISSVYIADDVNLNKVDLSPLYEMNAIKKITMQYLKGKIEFSKFSALETLYITKADSEIDILNVNGLKDLLLVSTKNTDCGFISNLKELESLRISSAKLKSLSGIESLCALKTLRITYCPSLLDISGVNKIKNLSHLYVEKCKGLTDFSFLSGNESIRDLFLSDVDSLAFIPSMKSIENIKFWNLKDGDMNFLFDAPTLKKVDFHPMKKNYTHKKDEINNIIGK